MKFLKNYKSYYTTYVLFEYSYYIIDDEYNIIAIRTFPHFSEHVRNIVVSFVSE